MRAAATGTRETGMASSHGRFVWYELATTDMEAAKAFYTGGRGLGHAGGGVVSLGTVFGGGSTCCGSARRYWRA
jgi:hypothetical protein